MKAQRRIIYRYSEAFKSQVVKEIEDGLSTITEVKKKYGIPGGGTVQNWIKRRGKLVLLSKTIRVEKPDEKARIKELERQIRQLKESLADTQVRYLLAESQFEIVCEQQGLNPEEVKKKLEEKNSSEQ